MMTSDARKNAVNYGSFELNIPKESFQDVVVVGVDSVYTLIGIDEPTKLVNLSNYIKSLDHQSFYSLKISVHQNSSYNMFIQVLDILQMNKFKFFFKDNSIYAKHSPKYQYPIFYESYSTVDEYEYILSRAKGIFRNVKNYLLSEPEPTVRIMRYLDEYPPLTKNGNIQDKYKSEIYFQAIGLWFLPVISVWLILFVLSIKRAYKMFAT
jgi:hypothetical protein